MAVTDETVSRVLNAVPKGLLIGGKWISTESTIDVEDPSTGQSIAQVADATPAQGIEALDAAVAAADDWAAHRPPRPRRDPAPRVRTAHRTGR